MARFPTLPEDTHLADVFKAFPAGVIPLLEYHDIILRAESPLSVAQRELIAAFVSGLNACDFCYGAHSIIAESFGIEKMIDPRDTRRYLSMLVEAVQPKLKRNAGPKAKYGVRP